MNRGTGLGILRLLRVARIFRVLKLAKYNEGLRMFARVMSQSLNALYLLSFFMALAVTIFGSMIYVAEGGVWDTEAKAYIRTDMMGRKTKSPFISIPASFWWVVVTSTTVGYGDMVPTTTAGYFIGYMAMFSGILVLALPITVIGSNFSMEYKANIAEQSQKIDTAVAAQVCSDTDRAAFPALLQASQQAMVSCITNIQHHETVEHYLANLDLCNLTPMQCHQVLRLMQERVLEQRRPNKISSTRMESRVDEHQ